jgi:hypothetical protein
VIDFDPDLSEWFILYAIVARQLCGEDQSEEESLFSMVVPNQPT